MPGSDTPEDGQNPTANQPDMVEAILRDVLTSLREQRGALLPILHAIHEELGCIPDHTVPVIADRLNLTRAEVHGVVSFYQDFRTRKGGRRTVRICQAESCQAAGSAVLTEAAQAQLGIGFEETTPDGAFTLVKVFCLGNCALSPSVMVEGTVYGRVTPERMAEILELEAPQRL
jgi:formate dehydrogenase subunit gamma